MTEFGRINVYLNKDYVLIAREMMRVLTGKPNLSALLNLLIEEFVMNGKEIEENPVHAQARALVDRKLKDLRAQRKLLEEARTEEQKAKDYLVNRQVAVQEATIKVLSTTPSFDRWRPENDLHGDLIDYYFQTIDRISQAAGYDVTPAEVEQIWRSIRTRAEQQINSRAGAIRQEEPAPGHQTPVGN